MAATITIYVDPDAVGANNGTSWADAYTSLQNAQNTEAKNLVAADEIYLFLCRNSGGGTDLTSIVMSNVWVCDATRKVIFRPAAGYEAIKTGWDATRYHISVDDNYALRDNTGALLVVELDHIQIERTFTAATFSTAIDINAVAAGSYYEFQGCRIRTENATTRAIRTNDADADVVLWDCIIEGTSRYGVDVTNGSVTMYNSILQGAQTDGFLVGAAGTGIVKNCAVFNNADDFDNSGAITLDYNASDDGDGGNPVAPAGGDWDNEFVDEANGDYTMLNTGNCYQGGTDNPGAGLYSDDMDGDAWVSPWSIGIDQYVSGSVVPQIMFLRLMGIGA